MAEPDSHAALHDHVAEVPTVRWIVMTLLAGCVAVAAKWLRERSRQRKLDVGAVSQEWIATHRADRLH